MPRNIGQGQFDGDLLCLADDRDGFVRSVTGDIGVVVKRRNLRLSHLRKPLTFMLWSSLVECRFQLPLVPKSTSYISLGHSEYASLGGRSEYAEEIRHGHDGGWSVSRRGKTAGNI